MSSKIVLFVFTLLLKSSFTFYQLIDPDTVWSDWTNWTPCSIHVFSSKCKRTRQRFCLKFQENPALCQGADKYGVEEASEECITSKCTGKFDFC